MGIVGRRATARLGALAALAALAVAAQAAEDPPGGAAATADAAAEAEADGAEASLDEIEPTARATGFDEILVTAEKREKSLQRSAASISTFDLDQLDDANIEKVEDLQFLVPNLHQGSQDGTPQFTIRGISQSTGIPGAQTVAFHQDGVFIASPSRLSTTFFDVERVEILRGPQGTVFGRNATGGAVNIIQVVPQDDFEAFGDIQYGNYDQIRTRAVVNAPLIEDRLMMRMSVFQEVRDGYQRNVSMENILLNPDDPPPLGIPNARFGDDREDVAGRLQLRLLIDDASEVTVRGFYGEADGVGPARKTLGDVRPDNASAIFFDALGVNENPSDRREIRLDQTGSLDTQEAQVNATYTRDLFDLPLLGDATLTVLGGWEYHDTDRVTDEDLTDIPLTEARNFGESHDWTTEARLNSAGTGPLSWLVGFFHWGNRTDDGVVSQQKGFAALDRTPRALKFSCDLNGVEGLPSDPCQFAALTREIEQEAYAVFGEVEYEVLEDVTVRGGLRFSHDRRRAKELRDSFDVVIRLGTGGPEFLRVPAQAALSFEQSALDESWQAVTGKLGVDWQWRQDSLAYVTATRGYKAGSLNPGAIGDTNGDDVIDATDIAESLGDAIAEPEIVWALEAGSKNQLFDRTLQANLVGFWYDYTDLQVPELRNTVTFVDNAGKATILGLELELGAYPLRWLMDSEWDDLLIYFNLGALRARFDEYSSVDLTDQTECGFTDVDGNMTYEQGTDVPTECDRSGNSLTRAPEVNLSIGAQWDLDFGRYGTFTPIVHTYWTDEAFYRPHNKATDLEEAYTKTGARVRWTSEDARIELEAFVDNIEDKSAIQSQVVGAQLIGFPVQSVLNAPRTYGLRLGLAW